MMASISINPAHAADEHYRYRMDRLQVKPDGRNKQRRTDLINLDTVSRQLCRSPELVRTYFARAVGTTGGLDRKSGIDIHFLSGHFTCVELERHLGAFCVRFVCCPVCGDCGTRLYACGDVKKKKRADLRLRLSCGACGHDCETAEQDARLAKVCIDGAPKLEVDAAASVGSGELKQNNKAKEEKKSKKVASHKKKKEAKSDKEGESDCEVEWFTDCSAEAVEARRREALGMC